MNIHSEKFSVIENHAQLSGALSALYLSDYTRGVTAVLAGGFLSKTSSFLRLFNASPSKSTVGVLSSDRGRSYSPRRTPTPRGIADLFLTAMLRSAHFRN